MVVQRLLVDVQRRAGAPPGETVAAHSLDIEAHRLVPCHDILVYRQLVVADGVPIVIDDDHARGLLPERRAQAGLLRFDLIFARDANLHAVVAVGQDMLELREQRAAGVGEVFESLPEEAQDVVVTGDPTPREDLVQRTELAGPESQKSTALSI